MPGGHRAQYSGNAWLLREANGIVEVVTADGRFIRGRKFSREAPEPAGDGANSPVQIQPANLDQDLKVFSSGLQSGNDEERYGSPESQAEMKARIAGGSLLFLAQLQRQGRGDFVREALPQVLALAPSPDMALDRAVSLLADGQFASLARQWSEKGDAAAYAAGIDRLAATFPRGWENRDAALFLAARLREQKAAPLAGEADARQAAELLLKLKPGDFAELPMGRNWFISGAGRGRGYGRFSGGEDEDGEPARNPAKKDGPLTAFFAKKREAATALAKLLDDRRYLRFDGPVNSVRTYRSSFGGHNSREEAIRERYNQIPRPREMGEIAWAILSPVLPGEIRSAAEERPATRAAVALAWLKTVAARSDEEMAWDYLRTASSTYDNEFRNGLSFLVEKGGPDTLVKLKEVFLDPAVWNSSSMDEMIRHTEKYVKRAPADAAFPDKLRAAVKAGLAAEEAGNRSSHFGLEAEEMNKQLAAQRSAQMKQIEQLFKPPQGVAEQLAEIVAMEETEALASFGAIEQSLAKRPLSEIEPPIFQAAAKAKPVALKWQMLELLLNVSMRSARGQPTQGTAAPPAVPGDAATREAMLDLLRDETTVPDQNNPADFSKIGDMASWVLLGLHSSQAPQNDWERIQASVPHLAKKWMHTHALAIVGGQPLPPAPNAAKLAAGRAAALVTELGALPAAQVLAALDGKTPDEQLGLVVQLIGAADWPAAIAEAHLAVREVSGPKAADLGGAAWKGRRLDEKLAREIQTAVENAAAGGKFFVVNVSVGEPLSGLEISVHEFPRMITEENFAAFGMPGLSGKPTPVAHVYAAIESTDMSAKAPDARGREARLGFPIWKDAAITRAWREEHGKPVEKTSKNDEDDRRLSTNPASFERRLRACLSLQKDARGPFRLMFVAMGISTGKPKNNAGAIND